MKKLLLVLFVCSVSYSQQINKEEYLENYAICDCLTQAYNKNGIKLNDNSINAWFDGSFLTTEQEFKFKEFIVLSVKKNYQ